jgi:hypothetical protein
MAAWDPETAREIYPRFRKRLKKGPHNTLYLASVGPNESAEISTVGLNTAFAAVFAREVGDQTTFERLQAWTNLHLDLVTAERGERYYQVKPAPYVTALLALAQTLPATGGGLHSLLAWRPNFEAPYLAEASPGIDVTAADWDGQALKIRLQAAPGTSAELSFGNIAFRSKVTVQGVEVAINEEWLGSGPEKSELTLKVDLPPNSTEVLVRAE